MGIIISSAVTQLLHRCSGTSGTARGRANLVTCKNHGPCVNKYVDSVLDIRTRGGHAMRNEDAFNFAADSRGRGLHCFVPACATGLGTIFIRHRSSDPSVLHEPRKIST